MINPVTLTVKRPIRLDGPFTFCNGFESCQEPVEGEIGTGLHKSMLFRRKDLHWFRMVKRIILGMVKGGRTTADARDKKDTA